ncbi:MAG: hypothetical protein QM704_09775 [Anaeromyxobacteraceae bacterium]
MPLAPLTAVARPVGPAPVPGPRASFQAALEARGAGPAARAGTLPAAARQGLDAVAAAQARLDGVLAAARSGRTFTARELLALQAEAYRAVQVVDLAGKLVEQGAQSVKHALNTQL